MSLISVPFHGMYSAYSNTAAGATDKEHCFITLKHKVKYIIFLTAHPDYENKLQKWLLLNVRWIFQLMNIHIQYTSTMNSGQKQCNAAV